MSIHQDALPFAGLFDGGERARYSLTADHKGYVHIVRGNATVNGHALVAGDALKTDGGDIEIGQGKAAEVMLFDLPGDWAGN